MLADPERMRAHEMLRAKVFLPVRPLAYYTDALTTAGITLTDVACRTIEARILDWFEFLAAYREAVIGWVGGVAKIENHPAGDEAVRDRLALMKRALDELSSGHDNFHAAWTYMTGHSRRA